jgi:hypothetical protein
LIIGAVIGTGILHKEKAGISGQVRWLLDKWDWGRSGSRRIATRAATLTDPPIS